MVIYSTNIIPKSWYLGFITLIHKEGPKKTQTTVGVYISPSKVLSTMMNQPLIDNSKANSMINTYSHVNHWLMNTFLTTEGKCTHALSTFEKSSIPYGRKGFSTNWKKLTLQEISSRPSLYQCVSSGGLLLTPCDNSI